VNNPTGVMDLRPSGVAPLLLSLLRLPLPSKTAAMVARIIFTAGGSNPSVAKYYKDELKSSPVVITTLAAVVRDRSIAPFPYGGGRGLLAVELLKIIFLFATVDVPPVSDGDMEGKGDSKFSSSQLTQSPALEVEDRETMTQLGILLVELLVSLPLDAPDAVEIKMQVVSVLMYMPSEYSYYMRANGAVPALIELLDFQTKMILIDGLGNISTSVTPLIIILNMMAGASHLALDDIKQSIFPPERDAINRANRLRDDAMLKELEATHTGSEEELFFKKQKIKGKSMSPEDAPRDSLR
jgi:hypothetical protein